jgi:putative tributyrin esterase
MRAPGIDDYGKRAGFFWSLARRAVLGAMCALALAGAVSIARSFGSHASGASLELRSYASSALRGREHVAVYLPAGYRGGDRHYPVIYYLHGLPGSATSYSDERIRGLGQSVDRSGRQAIVVGIQGARRGDTDPEWHDWGPGRNWETAAASEVVHYVDRHYRTIARRSGRALIGLSAGGYGATIIGFHHPETYSVVESWSGYFHPTTPDGRDTQDVGGDRENRLASGHTYVRKALRIYARHPTFLGFYVGTRDTRFRSENEQFDRELRRYRVPHVFAVYPGSHSGGFWDEHEDDWIVTAVDHLSHAG